MSFQVGGDVIIKLSIRSGLRAAIRTATGAKPPCDNTVHFRSFFLLLKRENLVVLVSVISRFMSDSHP